MADQYTGPACVGKDSVWKEVGPIEQVVYSRLKLGTLHSSFFSAYVRVSLECASLVASVKAEHPGLIFSHFEDGSQSLHATTSKFDQRRKFPFQ